MTVSFSNTPIAYTLTLGGTSSILNIASGCTLDAGLNAFVMTNAASFSQAGSVTVGNTVVTLSTSNSSIGVGQIVVCPGTLGYQTVAAINGTALTLSSANNVLATNATPTLTFYNTALLTGTGTFRTKSTSLNPTSDCYWPFTVVYNGTGTQYVKSGVYTNLTFTGDRGGAAFNLTTGAINIINTLSTSGLSNYTWAAPSGTVNFMGISDQTVPSFLYSSLTNSVYKDYKLTAAGNLTVNGSLNLTNNTIFSDGGYTITVVQYVAGTGTHYSPNPSGAGKISMVPTVANKSFSSLTSMGNFEINGGANLVTANSTTLQAGCTFTVADGANLSTSKIITPAGAGCTFALNGMVSLNGSSGVTYHFTSANSPILTLGSNSTIVYTNTTGQSISPLSYANLTITGARAATIITIPSGTIGISGVLDLTGLSFTTGSISMNTSSTINFNKATGGQTIPSLLGVSYNNLSLGNSSGTQTLGGAVTVNKVLSLTSGGTLSLAANDLTLGASSSISGTSATSYVVTDGVGKLIQPVAANTNKLFPIGTSVSSYDPATINATTATTFSAKVSSTLSGSIPTGVVYNAKEWSLTPASASSTIVSLTPSADVSGLSPDFMGVYDGISTYANQSVTPVGTTYSRTVTDFVSGTPMLMVTGKTDAATGEIAVVKSKLNVYTQGSELVICGLATGDLVTVIDISGQTLHAFIAKSTQSNIFVKQGVYIVKVQTKSELKISKVIVR